MTKLKSKIQAAYQRYRDNKADNALLKSVKILTNAVTGEIYTAHFSLEELRCRCPKCQGQQPHQFQYDTLLSLERARVLSGVPMPLSSAYRCPEHPEERKKSKSGFHSKGLAVDIRVGMTAKREKIDHHMKNQGFYAVGRAKNFIHFDKRGYYAAWSYKK